MSEAFQEKVKYLCTLISTVEWSGIMFYSMEGSIKDPENCKFILEDILPMDKGDSTSTAYNFDKRVDDYVMEDVETRVQWHIGHIHSHHTMPVFFSGVDMSEIVDNSKAHNIYLSLIVNNALDYKAKVAFRGKVEQIVEELPFIAQDEMGEDYEIGKGKVKVTADKFYTYDCDIEAPDNQKFNSQGWDFAKQVAILFDKPKYTPPVKTYTPPPKQQVGKNGVLQLPGLPHVQRNGANNFQHLQPVNQEVSDIPEMEDVEQVLASTLKGSLVAQGEGNLVSTLDELQAVLDKDIDANLISEQIANHLPTWYDNIIADEDVEGFLDFLDEAITIVGDLVDFYEFMGATHEVLKGMYAKLEEDHAATV